jgi:tetratricopeptide (TPR) repeat protein
MRHLEISLTTSPINQSPPNHSPPWSIRLFGSPHIEVAGQSVAGLSDNKDDLLLIYLAISPGAAHPRRILAQTFWPRRDLDDGLKRLSYTLWLLRQRLEALGIYDAVSASRATLRLNPNISTDVKDFRAHVLRANTTPGSAERAQLLRRAVDLYGGGLLPAFEYPWLEGERIHLEAMYQEAVQALAQAQALEALGAVDHHVLAPIGHGHDRETAPAADAAWRPSSIDGPALLRERASPLQPAADGLPARPLTPAEERDRLLDQVERAEENLAGSDQHYWLSRVDAQYPAIEAALEWAIEIQSRTYGLRLASNLWRYWVARSRLAEGQWFIEQLLVLPGQAPANVEATARHCAGVLACRLHQLPRAEQQFGAAILYWQAAGDKIGEMRSLADLADAAHKRGDYPTARRSYDVALAIARQEGEDGDLAPLLSAAALTGLDLREPLSARDLLREGLEVARRIGDERLSATLMVRLASADLMAGDDVTAATHARGALDQLRGVGNKRGAALALRILGRVVHNRGNFQGAIPPLIESLATAREAKDLGETGETLRCLAEARQAAGDRGRATETFQQAAQLLEAAGDPYGTLNDIPASARTISLPPASGVSGTAVAVPGPRRIADPPASTLEDLLRLVQEAEPHLSGGNRAIWLERLDAHYDDIRASLDRAVERSDTTFGLAMASALWRYWRERDMVDEGRWFLEQLLPTRSTPTTYLHAQALHAAGTLAMIENDCDHARRRLNEALVIWRQLDDDAALVNTLSNLGTIAYSTGGYEQARTIYGECLALARRMGDERALLSRLHNAALVEIVLGEPERARAFLQERLDLAGRLDDQRAVASALAHLAATALLIDDFTTASEHASRAAELYRSLGDQRGEALAQRLLGRTAHDVGDYPAALRYYQESLRLARASGNMNAVGETLRYQADTCFALESYSRASSLARQAVKILEAEGDTRAAAKARELLAEIQAAGGGHATSPSST